MTDPRDETIALLRRLAVACDDCLRIAETEPGHADRRVVYAQRAVLMRALPDVSGWPATRDRLHALADALEVPDDR